MQHTPRPTPAGLAAPRDRTLDDALVRARRTEPDGFRQDLRAALVALVVGLGLLAIGLTGIWSAGDTVDPDRWWHAVPLVLGTAAMLVKRQRPLLALAAGVVLALVDAGLGGSLGTIVVLVDLLYAAGLYATRRARQVLLAVVWSLVAVSAVVAGVAADGDPRAVVVGAIQGVGFLVVPLWWAANVRQKSELAVLAEERADLAKAHADGLERIAELRRLDSVQAERRTMARDLHDVVAGHVSAIAIRTGAELASPAGRERETLEMVRRTSLTALYEMRAMILLLRSDDTADVAVSAPGTLDDLEGVLAAHRAAGVDVVVVDRAPRDLPAAVGQAALRIVQEAVTNASKHGGPGPVRVALEVHGAVHDAHGSVHDAHGAVLEVSVTSALAAHGANGSLGSGTGLVGMRERAESLGGTLESGPAGARGTTWEVRALLPCRPGAARAGGVL